jgi:hypothetical protein
VEQGPPGEVLDNPRHERTQRFLRLVERAAVNEEAPQQMERAST